MPTVVLSELDLHAAAARAVAARCEAHPELGAVTVEDATSCAAALAALRGGQRLLVTLTAGAPDDALAALTEAPADGSPAPVILVPRRPGAALSILGGPRPACVLEPADDLELEAQLDAALLGSEPCVIQLGGPLVRRVHAAAPTARPGHGEVLLEGEELAILACGSAVGEALAAALDLQTRSIRPRVVNLSSLSPIHGALVVRCADELGRLLVVEEPAPWGLPGLLPAVRACLEGRPPVTVDHLRLGELPAAEPEPGQDPEESPAARAIQVAVLRRVGRRS